MKNTAPFVITAATSNSHKIYELQNKFSSLGSIVILPMGILRNVPEIIENGSTFSENSLIKAHVLADIFSTAVIADDSGLAVDQLNGEPGIFSARYGDRKTDIERYNLLLEKLEGVPMEKRSARFVCAITLIMPDGEVINAEESCEGVISEKPSGKLGFGYDPVFYIPDYKCTMAEISIEEKNKISHRGKALDKIYTMLYKKMQNI